MPEGPEIRRAADNLEAAIKGKPLTDVWFAFPQLKSYQSRLIGQHVTHVETRGKALLTHFSNDLTLYSHNQLYGVWRVVDTGEEPQTTRVLRVKLQTADKTILLYSASDIEMLTPEQLTTHPFLQRVGPDVLDPNLTPEVVKERMGRCFALRFFIVMANRANAVAASLRKPRCHRARFTGALAASTRPNASAHRLK